MSDEKKPQVAAVEQQVREVSMRVTEIFALTHGYLDTAIYAMSGAAKTFASVVEKKPEASGFEKATHALVHCIEIIETLRNELALAWERMSTKADAPVAEEPKPAEASAPAPAPVDKKLN